MKYISMANLAAVLHARAELEWAESEAKAEAMWAQAEPIMREACEGLRRVLNPQHPQTLISIGRLMMLLYAQEKYEEAEPLASELDEGCRKIDARHLDALQKLGDVLEKLGWAKQASHVQSVAKNAKTTSLFNPGQGAGQFNPGQGADSSRRCRPAVGRTRGAGAARGETLQGER